MQRYLLLAVLLSALTISCGGPNVIIQYQGSSPIPPVHSDTLSADSQSDSESHQPDTFVTVLSIPSLDGGNRALRKRINYPDEAIRQGVEGTVTIQFTIDEEGNTTNFSTIEGIGYGCEEAVIEAINQSQFDPGHIDTETTARYTWLVEVEFKL